ncbi:hypothetical protein CWI38_1082p0030 [Hamiltosporidium tvaerminnensis]|uniref:Uncharacterized protein n=2 Tax=Hamiltosporidium TaxID=1176354 RepID=A0A4Q9LEY1_9MICR|nr:hypothetical protein CWI39_0471p0010 [Hamiltosporidium magnivora]TBU11686.1 hypothetical protein CWI38_1082p0030 [Hamiltosporidium tvaerminnensis]
MFKKILLNIVLIGINIIKSTSLEQRPTSETDVNCYFELLCRIENFGLKVFEKYISIVGNNVRNDCGIFIFDRDTEILELTRFFLVMFPKDKKYMFQSNIFLKNLGKEEIPLGEIAKEAKWVYTATVNEFKSSTYTLSSSKIQDTFEYVEKVEILRHLIEKNTKLQNFDIVDNFCFNRTFSPSLYPCKGKEDNITIILLGLAFLLPHELDVFEFIFEELYRTYNLYGKNIYFAFFPNIKSRHMNEFGRYLTSSDICRYYIFNFYVKNINIPNNYKTSTGIKILNSKKCSLYLTGETFTSENGKELTKKFENLDFDKDLLKHIDVAKIKISKTSLTTTSLNNYHFKFKAKLFNNKSINIVSTTQKLESGLYYVFLLNLCDIDDQKNNISIILHTNLLGTNMKIDKCESSEQITSTGDLLKAIKRKFENVLIWATINT